MLNLQVFLTVLDMQFYVVLSVAASMRRTASSQSVCVYGDGWLQEVVGDLCCMATPHDYPAAHHPITTPLRESRSEREKAEVGEKKMVKRFRSDGKSDGEGAQCRGGVREMDMVSKETKTDKLHERIKLRLPKGGGT